MIQRIYFSIHYCDDIDRVNQITPLWLSDSSHSAEGRWYDEEFMKILPKGDKAVEAYIDRLRAHSDMIVVLIGERTAQSRLVHYEITQAVNEDLPMIGIYIHQLKNKKGILGVKGSNPFDQPFTSNKGSVQSLKNSYPVYDWIDDDGPQNFLSWVQQAPKLTK